MLILMHAKKLYSHMDGLLWDKKSFIIVYLV